MKIVVFWDVMSSLEHMDVSKQRAAFTFGLEGSRFLADIGTNPHTTFSPVGDLVSRTSAPILNILFQLKHNYMALHLAWYPCMPMLTGCPSY